MSVLHRKVYQLTDIISQHQPLVFTNRGEAFALSLFPRGGEFTLSKAFPDGLPGGSSGLELTDTLFAGFYCILMQIVILRLKISNFFFFLNELIFAVQQNLLAAFACEG